MLFLTPLGIFFFSDKIPPIQIELHLKNDYKFMIYYSHNGFLLLLIFNSSHCETKTISISTSFSEQFFLSFFFFLVLLFMIYSDILYICCVLFLVAGMKIKFHITSMRIEFYSQKFVKYLNHIPISCFFSIL